jgi:hypothetical protein
VVVYSRQFLNNQIIFIVIVSAQINYLFVSAQINYYLSQHQLIIICLSAN